VQRIVTEAVDCGENDILQSRLELQRRPAKTPLSDLSALPFSRCNIESLRSATEERVGQSLVMDFSILDDAAQSSIVPLSIKSYAGQRRGLKLFSLRGCGSSNCGTASLLNILAENSKESALLHMFWREGAYPLPIFSADLPRL
jgi:hypothetical protein